MTFSEKSIFNIQFLKVYHKVGKSAINDVNIFHNDQNLTVSVGNSYPEDK